MAEYFDYRVPDPAAIGFGRHGPVIIRIYDGYTWEGFVDHHGMKAEHSGTWSIDRAGNLIPAGYTSDKWRNACNYALKAYRGRSMAKLIFRCKHPNPAYIGFNYNETVYACFFDDNTWKGFSEPYGFINPKYGALAELSYGDYWDTTDYDNIDSYTGGVPKWTNLFNYATKQYEKYGRKSKSMSKVIYKTKLPRELVHELTGGYLDESCCVVLADNGKWVGAGSSSQEYVHIKKLTVGKKTDTPGWGRGTESASSTWSKIYQYVQKQMKKEKSMSINQTIKQSITTGVKQAATDEAGEALVDLFTQLVGDPEWVNTKERREVAKGLMGAALIVLSDNLDLPVDTTAVREAASLQVQTATMRLLGPHMAKLREAATVLVEKAKA